MKWALSGLIALFCLAFAMPETWADGRTARRMRKRHHERVRIEREQAERVGFVFRTHDGPDFGTPSTSKAKPPNGKRSAGLESLEWLIGEWVAKDETEDGETAHYTINNQWSDGRLISHQTIRSAGKVASTFTLVYAWNSEEKQIDITGSGSKGGAVSGSMEPARNQVEVTLSGHDGEMEDVEFTLALESGEDQTIYQTEPNEHPLVWRRKPATP